MAGHVCSDLLSCMEFVQPFTTTINYNRKIEGTCGDVATNYILNWPPKLPMKLDLQFKAVLKPLH
jgi:hypothetical protein